MHIYGPVQAVVPLGVTILSFCKEACEFARQHKCEVWFKFNGTEVRVDGKTDAEDAARGWQAKRDIEQRLRELERTPSGWL